MCSIVYRIYDNAFRVEERVCKQMEMVQETQKWMWTTKSNWCAENEIGKCDGKKMKYQNHLLCLLNSHLCSNAPHRSSNTVFDREYVCTMCASFYLRLYVLDEQKPCWGCILSKITA